MPSRRGCWEMRIKMEDKKISIIVPVYRAERYLRKCVDSILAQTHKNLEVILVDDGSPDGCPALCDECAQRYPSVVKVIHKENGGVSSARNAGLDAATGDYIGFVDSDDWIEPDMYEFLLDVALKQQADIAQCGYCSDSPEHNGFWAGVRGETAGDGAWGAEQLLCGDFSFVSLCTKLTRRELFQEVRLDTSLHCCEDMLAVFGLMKQAQKVVFINACKYHYMRDGTSALAGVLQEWHILDQFAFHQKIEPYYQADARLTRIFVKHKVESFHFLMGSIVRNDLLWEYYPKLRRAVLTEKRAIVFGKEYSLKYRAVTVLLWLWPWGYNKAVLIRRAIRGY